MDGHLFGGADAAGRGGGGARADAAANTRLVRVATLCMAAARLCVSAYSCPKSRRDFTQRQLLACLVLKAITKSDYRGVRELLLVAAPLREAIGLEKVPHWTTLQKFMAKSNVPALVDTLLERILREVGATQHPVDVAVDSTGLQSGVASLHYRTRRWETGRQRARKPVKVSVAVVCGSLLPAALVVDIGPSADMRQMPQLMEQIESRLRPAHLLADAGFDAEWVHEVCRERWGVESLIPPVVKSQDGALKTRWRRRMPGLLASMGTVYGRRWHAESFFSGLKRTTMATLSSRSARTLIAEASLKVLAYALRRRPPRPA